MTSGRWHGRVNTNHAVECRTGVPRDAFAPVRRLENPHWFGDCYVDLRPLGLDEPGIAVSKFAEGAVTWPSRHSTTSRCGVSVPASIGPPARRRASGRPRVSPQTRSTRSRGGAIEHRASQPVAISGRALIGCHVGAGVGSHSRSGSHYAGPWNGRRRRRCAKRSTGSSATRRPVGSGSVGGNGGRALGVRRAGGPTDRLGQNRRVRSADVTARGQHLAAVDLGRLDQEWWDRAACRGQRTALFFPTPGGAAATAQAIPLCRRCPVRSPCLDYAMHTAAVGIWAGTTDEERRRLRRRR